MNFLDMLRLLTDDAGLPRRSGTDWQCCRLGPTPEAVTAARDGAVYHDDHACPECGTDEFDCYLIEGTGPKPNTHLHTCPSCGKVWYHRDR